MQLLATDRVTDVSLVTSWRGGSSAARKTCRARSSPIWPLSGRGISLGAGDNVQGVSRIKRTRSVAHQAEL